MFLISTLFIVLGALLQGIFLINLFDNFKFKKRKFAILLAMSLFILFYMHFSSHSMNPISPATYTLSFILIFSLLIVIIFKKYALSSINSRNVFILTILFWYIVSGLLGYSTKLFTIDFRIFVTLFGVFLIPSFISLVSVLFKFKLNSFIKFFLYIWFLIIMIFLSFFVSWDLLSLFKGVSEGLSLKPITAFMFGSVLTYTYVNVFFLFMFIPNFKLGYKVAISNIKEYISLLISKYNDYYMNLFETLAWVIFIFLTFYINNKYIFLDKNVIVGFILIILYIVELFTIKRDAIE